MSLVPPASAAAGRPVASDVRVADLDRRFYAFVVDRLVGWGLDAVVAVVVGRPLWSHGHRSLAVLVVVATVLAVGLLFSLVLGVTGATPGRRLFGLRLVDTGTGEPIGVGPAVLRTSVLGLAAVPFGFGLAGTRLDLRRGHHPAATRLARPPRLVDLARRGPSARARAGAGGRPGAGAARQPHHRPPGARRTPGGRRGLSQAQISATIASYVARSAAATRAGGTAPSASWSSVGR